MQIGPKDPRRQKAADRLAHQDFLRKEKERLKKKYAEQHRGEKKINGRFYKEHAVCSSKHDALKVEKELRDESEAFTHIEMTKKGWIVYAMVA